MPVTQCSCALRASKSQLPYPPTQPTQPPVQTLGVTIQLTKMVLFAQMAAILSSDGGNTRALAQVQTAGMVGVGWDGRGGCGFAAVYIAAALPARDSLPDGLTRPQWLGHPRPTPPPPHSPIHLTSLTPGHPPLGAYGALLGLRALLRAPGKVHRHLWRGASSVRMPGVWSVSREGQQGGAGMRGA